MGIVDKVLNLWHNYLYGLSNFFDYLGDAKSAWFAIVTYTEDEPEQMLSYNKYFFDFLITSVCSQEHF